MSNHTERFRKVTSETEKCIKCEQVVPTFQVQYFASNHTGFKKGPKVFVCPPCLKAKRGYAYVISFDHLMEPAK